MKTTEIKRASTLTIANTGDRVLSSRSFQLKYDTVSTDDNKLTLWANGEASFISNAMNYIVHKIKNPDDPMEVTLTVYGRKYNVTSFDIVSSRIMLMGEAVK